MAGKQATHDPVGVAMHTDLHQPQIGTRRQVGQGQPHLTAGQRVGLLHWLLGPLGRQPEVQAQRLGTGIKACSAPKPFCALGSVKASHFKPAIAAQAPPDTWWPSRQLARREASEPRAQTGGRRCPKPCLLFRRNANNMLLDIAVAPCPEAIRGVAASTVVCRRMPMHRSISLSRVLLTLVVFALSACGGPAPLHSLPRPDQFARATSPGAVTTKEGVPLNLRWDQLSDAQRAVVRSWYVDIPPGDEPPYPRDGLRPVIDAVWQGQHRMRDTGDLMVVATVNGRGETEEVKAFGTTDKALVDYISRVVMKTRFKPAVCGGAPCRMDFPLNLRMKLE